MKLYYAPNTIAVAAAVALNEARLICELKKLDFAAQDQSGAAYLGINPKGRVPALVLEDRILTETGAILEFVAGTAPEADLVPRTALDAARMRSVMYYLASTMHVNHAHKMRGHRWADHEASLKDMQAKVPETMTASVHYVEAECLTGPFVMGEQISLADCYLFAISLWLEGDGVDLTQFPKMRAFIAAMEDRESVTKARAMGVIV